MIKLLKKGLGLLVGGFGMASKLGPSYFHIDTIDEKKVLSTSNSPARHSVYGLGVFGLVIKKLFQIIIFRGYLLLLFLHLSLLPTLLLVLLEF